MKASVVHFNRCAEKDQDFPRKMCFSEMTGSDDCISHLGLLVVWTYFFFGLETINEVRTHNNVNKIPDI